MCDVGTRALKCGDSSLSKEVIAVFCENQDERRYSMLKCCYKSLIKYFQPYGCGAPIMKPHNLVLQYMSRNAWTCYFMIRIRKCFAPYTVSCQMPLNDHVRMLTKLEKLVLQVKT